MRRAYALLGFCALLLTALVAVPISAQARPVSAAAAADCGTSGYPFQPDATVFTSATAVKEGQRIEVSGSGYCGNNAIAITIDGASVGSANTDGNGSFDPPVTVPSGTGDKQLCATGATKVSSGSNSDCLTLHVSASGTAPVSSGSGGGDNGGTAFTGVQIGLLIALAALLVGGGGAFVLVGRRRSGVLEQ